MLNFPHSWDGIQQFLSWLQTIDKVSQNVIIGVEGRGGKGSGFIASMLSAYEHVYEVNPQYTRQRRQFGTRGGKSDVRDAKCIAEVIIKKLPELPKITQGQLSSRQLTLKRLVWYYEEETKVGARLKNHLRQLEREHLFSIDPDEKKLIAQLIRDKRSDLKRITQKRKSLATRLSQLLAGHEANLTSIPGVSTILAAKIAAHADHLERFATVDKFLQYAGIAPLEKASGKVKKAVQNNKGNRALNSTIYMVAVGQINHNPKGKEYYRKKLSEGKTKKHALRCVMKRIAMIIYGMLKNGEEYRG
jgi:transposase